MIGLGLRHLPRRWPGKALAFHLRHPIPGGKVTLGATADCATQRYSINGVGACPVLGALLVSDEGGRGDALFTGAFAGMPARDLTGQG